MEFVLFVLISLHWSIFRLYRVYSDYTSSFYLRHCFVTKGRRRIIDVYIYKDERINLYFECQVTFNQVSQDFLGLDFLTSPASCFLFLNFNFYLNKILHVHSVRLRKLGFLILVCWCNFSPQLTISCSTG